jgi:hypothetical protein
MANLTQRPWSGVPCKSIILEKKENFVISPILTSYSLQNYNLVIGVLAVFLHLTKGPMHVLRIWYPPLSAFVHGALTALFVASVVFQAGSDMTDPTAPQPGPPWYITKSCSVAYYPSDIGYCQQAKSLFAVCIIMRYAFSSRLHYITKFVVLISLLPAFFISHSSS